MNQAKKKALDQESKLIKALDDAWFKLNRLYNDTAFYKNADLARHPEDLDIIGREYAMKQIDIYIGELIEQNEESKIDYGKFNKWGLVYTGINCGRFVSMFRIQ